MSFTGFVDPNNPTSEEITSLIADLYSHGEWYDRGHGWYHRQAAMALEALNVLTPAKPQAAPEPEPVPVPPVPTPSPEEVEEIEMEEVEEEGSAVRHRRPSRSHQAPHRRRS